MDTDNNSFNAGLLVVATILVAKIISWFLVPQSVQRLPLIVNEYPVVGGFFSFLKGPIVLLHEEYSKLGNAFTVKLINKKITFLIGLEVSAHFFKVLESDLSQQEVY